MSMQAIHSQLAAEPPCLCQPSYHPPSPNLLSGQDPISKAVSYVSLLNQQQFTCYFDLWVLTFKSQP